MAIQTTFWVKDGEMTEKAPTIVNMHTAPESRPTCPPPGRILGAR